MSADGQAPPQPQTPTSARPASFAGHVLQLVTGAAATQVLAFVLSPFIARLYAPETFGAAATFAAALAILASIVTMRYELAILLPRTDERAGAIACGGLLLVVLSCGLLFALWGLLRSAALDGGLRALVAAPGLLPLALLLSGATTLLTYWGIRHEKFGLLSANRVTSASVAEAGRVLLGLVGRDTASSLIIANMVGVLAGLAVLVSGLRRQLRPIRDARLSQAAAALYEYRKFPLFSSWAGLLNTLSHQLSPLVLGAYFAADIVGYYSQANRIALTPLLLLSGAIAQVFARSAARAKHEGDLPGLTTATARNLLRLAWYPAIVLLCLGPDLTTWFLGAPWATSGRYVQILAIWMLTTLISHPLTALYAVLERQELGMALNLALLVFRVGGLAIGGLRGDPTLSLVLFAASGSLLNVVQIVLLVRLARGRLLPALGTALLCAAYTAPLLLLMAARPWLGKAPGVAVLLALAGALCYAALWAATDPRLRALAAELWSQLPWRAPQGRHGG